MSLLLQHILALSIVALCVGYAGWQGVRAIRGKRSRVGSCCATGCEKAGPSTDAAPAGPRIVYLPVSMLSRRRKG